MEDFAVTCPLVLGVPHLRSGSCTSPRAFGLGFLQTPSHDDALALLLAFGSSYTWLEDFHLDRSLRSPAHPLGISGRAQRRPLNAVVSALRVLEVRALPKQRLEGLLVFFVILKSVDIHGVVDN